jgi:6-phosphogluconolactonase
MTQPARILRSIALAVFAVVPLLTVMFPLTAAAADASAVVYVGTYTDHGSKGIYAYRFDPATGELKELGLAAESANPSFLTADPQGQFLYAANEVSSFEGKPTGAVTAFAVDAAAGKLSPLNEVSSVSPGPAYITLDRSGRYALIANYPKGSVASFPIGEDGRIGEAAAFVQHHGHSVNPQRQEGPHAHAVAMSPDNRFALVADLGLDQLLEYGFNAKTGALTDPKIVKTAPGSGPRHLVFSPNGKYLYVIYELNSTIVTYAYDAPTGALKQLQSVSTLPADFKEFNKAAEIAIDRAGRFLYASNRGNDSIAVFAIDPRKGTLTLVEHVPTQGKTPRHFAIDPSGKWLLVANQDSDNLVLFHITPKTGRLTPTGGVLHLSEPICAVFVERR